jgi:hypothetical protein
MNPPVEPNTELLPVQTLQCVKENPTSKREKKKRQIINYIVEDLQKNPILSKNDVASVARACQLVENMVKKKDKIDKLDLVVSIFNKIFQHLQPAEIDVIKACVQFVLDSKLIHKVKLSVQVYSYLRKVVIHNCLFRDE